MRAAKGGAELEGGQGGRMEDWTRWEGSSEPGPQQTGH